MAKDPPARPVLPPDAEICANFWFIITSEHMIVRLLARFYLLVGNEATKRQTLRQAATHDWVIARQFAVPERFHVTTPLLRRVLPVTPLAIWPIDAMMPLFEDAAQTLESELPGFTHLTLPQDPMTCFTPIFQHDDGRLMVAFDKSVRI